MLNLCLIAYLAHGYFDRKTFQNPLQLHMLTVSEHCIFGIWHFNILIMKDLLYSTLIFGMTLICCFQNNSSYGMTEKKPKNLSVFRISFPFRVLVTQWCKTVECWARIIPSTVLLLVKVMILHIQRHCLLPHPQQVTITHCFFYQIPVFVFFPDQTYVSDSKCFQIVPLFLQGCPILYIRDYKSWKSATLNSTPISRTLALNSSISRFRASWCSSL